ncbi:hypothetical protein ACFVTM_19515 [Arthrobacter sp. NPDC058130]|uniref:hypothetical protein n=1 Tax=Arthrobacter sp. NPDC058130 TaxID=3346353 RepID=UPI0036E8835C
MGLDDNVNRTVIHHIVAAKDGTGRAPGNEYLKQDGQPAQAPQEAGQRATDAADGKASARKLK